MRGPCLRDIFNTSVIAHTAKASTAARTPISQAAAAHNRYPMIWRTKTMLLSRYSLLHQKAIAITITESIESH